MPLNQFSSSHYFSVIPPVLISPKPYVEIHNRKDRKVLAQRSQSEKIENKFFACFAKILRDLRVKKTFSPYRIEGSILEIKRGFTGRITGDEKKNPCF
jgi:hypothetical protein